MQVKLEIKYLDDVSQIMKSALRNGYKVGVKTIYKTKSAYALQQEVDYYEIILHKE